MFKEVFTVMEIHKDKEFAVLDKGTAKYDKRCRTMYHYKSSLILANDWIGDLLKLCRK